MDARQPRSAVLIIRARLEAEGDGDILECILRAYLGYHSDGGGSNLVYIDRHTACVPVCRPGMGKLKREKRARQECPLHRRHTDGRTRETRRDAPGRVKVGTFASICYWRSMSGGRSAEV